MEQAPKFLIVDDDRNVRKLFATALERYGFQPLVAATGREALSLLDRHPDVAAVIADWMLPHMDGLELTRRIRRRPDSPPVLMVSARSRREDVLAAVEAGVTDYMAKPVNVGRLILRLNAILQRQSAPDETAEAPVMRWDASMPFEILDLSETGCCLESPFALPEATVLYIESEDLSRRLGVPPEQTYYARVANCRSAGRRFRIGAQFVGMSEALARRLRATCS